MIMAPGRVWVLASFFFKGCPMSNRFLSHFLVLFLSVASASAGAADLKNVNAQLYQVQLTEAKKGDARAQYFLGEMYERGLGTTQNIDEAFKWYAKAAQQGDPLAKRKMGYRAMIEKDLKQQMLSTHR